MIRSLLTGPDDKLNIKVNVQCTKESLAHGNFHFFVAIMDPGYCVIKN
jgi:hypothetical protein